MKTQRALFALAVAATLLTTACARPLKLDISATPRHVPDSAASAVQVRYFSYSPGVAVVAWDTADPRYGLRAWIRRDGALVRDHQIFVSTYYEAGVRRYPFAAVGGRNLLLVGTSRDIFACWFGDTCSPQETYGARIPDALLRTGADSVTVKFYMSGRQLLLPLHHELIARYLARVDSISAELRRQQY